MNKSEFIKLEKECGLNVAICELFSVSQKFKEGNYFVWDTEELIDYIMEAVYNYNFDCAMDNLKILKENIGFDGYWLIELDKNLIEPIKNIKDVEEFFEEDSKNDN